jgi:hypothetical protein
MEGDQQLNFAALGFDDPVGHRLDTWGCWYEMTQMPPELFRDWFFFTRAYPGIILIVL